MAATTTKRGTGATPLQGLDQHVIGLWGLVLVELAALLLLRQQFRRHHGG